jgi:hypothetical protein
LPGEGAGHVERGLAHPERVEHQRLHGGVVGGAELAVRVDEVAADVAGGGGHQVVVLEHLAEPARRLRGGELREGRGRRRVAARCEDPAEVLARQPRARAHEVLDEDGARGRRVAEAEPGVDLRHRLVPPELP